MQLVDPAPPTTPDPHFEISHGPFFSTLLNKYLYHKTSKSITSKKCLQSRRTFSGIRGYWWCS
jgi:hypothetical protein